MTVKNKKKDSKKSVPVKRHKKEDHSPLKKTDYGKKKASRDGTDYGGPRKKD